MENKLPFEETVTIPLFLQTSNAELRVNSVSLKFFKCLAFQLEHFICVILIMARDYDHLFKLLIIGDSGRLL